MTPPTGNGLPPRHPFFKNVNPAPEAAEVVQNSAAVIGATCNPIIFETTNQSPQTVDVPIWVGSCWIHLLLLVWYLKRPSELQGPGKLECHTWIFVHAKVCDFPIWYSNLASLGFFSSFEVVLFPLFVDVLWLYPHINDMQTRSLRCHLSGGLLENQPAIECIYRWFSQL